MENKKISIILPVYNAEKTISRTIDGVLKQINENYELIIINDGSQDSSGEICKKYSSQNTKIKYFEIENSGVSNARNIGLEKATGDYIMFIDSDDEYCKNTLSELDLFISNDIDLVVFGYERIHVDSNKIRIMTTNPINIEDGKIKNIFIEQMQKNYLFNQIWNKAYKRKILKENKIFFDVNISSGEDYRFNLKYIDVINNAIYIDKILYKYYTSEEGLSLRVRPDKIYIKLENLEEQRKLYYKMKYPTDYIDKNYVYTCLSGLTAMVNKDNPKKTEEYLKLYTQNKEIEKELKSIRKKTKDLKIKISISILLIKNILLLRWIVNVLIKLRKIYRKIKLG